VMEFTINGSDTGEITGIALDNDTEPTVGRRAFRFGGSDVDAGLYWLARMLEAGEDARFIARRLIILASEDVGMADPQALVVAVAAAHAIEHVGLPEGQLNLAQAVVHLATAPKSNRAALGIWNARTLVKDGMIGEVPAHLRDSHYQGATSLGHGTAYVYPHDDPRGWVPQQYGPDQLAKGSLYEPTQHGFEREVADRMQARDNDRSERPEISSDPGEVIT